VFTAPVLAANDPLYRGVRVPLRFWKVASWVTGPGGRLAAAGFVLDQTALVDTRADRARILPPLGGYRTFQVPISDIGRLAAVDFGPLLAADVFEDAPTAARQEWVELAGAADIRLSKPSG
jgi:endonuclease G